MDSVTITVSDAPVALGDSFTCMTCHLLFKEGVEQRDHYKTDVHRFNLKRKVAGLAPISPEIYEAKQKAMKAAEADAQANSNTMSDCTTCAKKFHSEAQLQQHLGTKKHKIQESKGPVQRPAKSETSSEASSVSTQLTEEQLRTMTDEELYEYRVKISKKLELTDCLFCREKSPTLKANLRHMTVEHGFFLPDIDYLTDLEGSIKYLGEKVSVGWTCLYCNGVGKSFNSMEAAQDHMRSSSHCKLLYEEEEQEEEFADFYDFTEYYTSKGMDPETGAEELKQNEFGELILADKGKIIGHRDLKHVYKQAANRPTASHDRDLIQSLVTEYRALAIKREQKAKMPPLRAIRKNQQMELRLGENANKIQRLRFRADGPI